MRPVAREIWVLSEFKNNGLDQVAWGIIEEGKRLAQEFQGRLVVVVLGHGLKNIEGIIEESGASKAYLVDHSLLKNYSADGYSLSLQELMEGKEPWLFLLADTEIGEDLAPRVAVTLNTGLVTHCVKISKDIAGRAIFSSSVYDGRFCQEVMFQEGRIQVVTICPEVLDKTITKAMGKTEVIKIYPHIEEEDIRTQHIGVIPPNPATVDISEAEVIVSAGRGCIGRGITALVQELAELIGGSLAATRPTVDEGLFARERLVGRTGKSVSPKIYLSLGISGSMHHVCGITESEVIICVNKDAAAPIFKFSDLGFVAPLEEFLPILIQRLKEDRR